ncbi:MAG TPA: hypothetical protein VN441_04255 [Syntrophomonas sp.]|nr:hypothetical protein [Syntrophomonas sp.]
MNHLAPFKLVGQTPPGTCPECATKHDPDMPHNQQSLTYQYKFYDRYGRWASWADAMKHCTSEVKKTWTQALRQMGIAVNAQPKNAGEIEIKIERR